MRILVADDSPVIRKAVSVMLTEAGYDVVTAEDGIQTIQSFYQDRPDLVVLDIQMPRMTGYMACRLLKEDWTTAHIPILILTAHDSAEDRYWAEKSGADGYLTKETLSDQLVAAIKSASVSRALSELSGTVPESQELDQIDVLARVTEMLDRKLFESTIANDLMTLTARSFDLDASAEEILFILRRFLAYDVGAISIVDEPTVMVRADKPVTAAALKLFTERALTDLSERQSGRLDERSVRIRVFGAGEGDDGLDVPEGWPSIFSSPLRFRQEVVGMLTLASATPNAFTPQMARTLRTVESPVATVVDSAIHQRRRMQEEARQSLSSLYSFDDLDS